MPSEEDRDEDLEEEGGSAALRILTFAFVVLVVGGFVMLARYAYEVGTTEEAGHEPPVVRAEATPVKEKPADPGGMAIPHQDKEIYQVLSGAAEKAPPPVEKVQLAPEKPVDVEEAVKRQDPPAAQNQPKQEPKPLPSVAAVTEAAKTGAADPRDVIEEYGKKAEGEAETTVSEKPAAEETAVEKPAAEKPVTAETKTLAPKIVTIDQTGKAEVKKIAEPAAKAEAKPAATAEAKIAKTEKAPYVSGVAEQSEREEVPLAGVALGGGKQARLSGTLVQLGSYRSQADAEAAWKKIYKAHSVLQPLSYTIKKAELGEKGIFYRLQAGPLADADAAKAVCRKLEINSQGCFVVK